MLRIILAFFLISISQLFVTCKTTKVQEPITVSEIPYFTLYTLDSQRFTKESFDTKRTKLILYFNSECEHCEKQAKWLSKDIELLSDLEMVFVSFEEMNAIKKFRDLYNFNQKNVKFLQDARLTFSNIFEVESFPSILIYNKKGRLIHKFEGETKVEKLLEFIPN
jgi:thioredoxin-related protein